MRDKQGIMNEGRSQWRPQRTWSGLPDTEEAQLCREQRRGRKDRLRKQRAWELEGRELTWEDLYFFHLKEGQWEAGVLRKETKFRVTVLMKNVFGHGTWMKSLFSCNKAQLASRVCDFLQARQGNLAQAYTEQREGPRKPHRDIDKQLGSEDRCVFNPWLCHCLIMKSCLVSTLRHICKKGNITSSNRFGCRMRMWSHL